jgi:UDP-N-acetylglucosamine--N-acetylmuramyl-(pentapeptide) pyrophosphoryl-undecaprenol N-acetylglucosamine transferase
MERAAQRVSEDLLAKGIKGFPIRVLVAASGTGGHLIPAMHIVSALKEINPECVIEFIGAGRPLEEKLIVEKGFTRHIVQSAGVKRRGLIGLAQFLFRLPAGIASIRRLYRSFQPDVVVGVGGYVSVLPVIIARLSGIPTWIHEAELSPGLANTVLCYFADCMSTGFAETKSRGRARAVYTGQPVRSELTTVNREKVSSGAPNHLLVLGGSQGARGLDESVSHIAPMLKERGVEVVHQCRADAMELVINSYRAAEVKAHVASFIDDMAGAYEWSDVIISRAGASSVAEISCVNRPALFVPYPYQQGTHQSDNAMTLVRKNKAILVEENQPHFLARLREALEKVLDPSTYGAMKSAPQGEVKLNAARTIAEGIFALVTSHKEPRQS